MSMNAVIYKYAFGPHDSVVISMPKGAKILAAQVQHNHPKDRGLQIWALVDLFAPEEDRTFEIFGTGYQMYKPETLVYITTFQDGSLVWHLFERVGSSTTEITEL